MGPGILIWVARRKKPNVLGSRMAQVHRCFLPRLSFLDIPMRGMIWGSLTVDSEDRNLDLIKQSPRRPGRESQRLGALRNFHHLTDECADSTYCSRDSVSVDLTLLQSRSSLSVSAYCVGGSLGYAFRHPSPIKQVVICNGNGIQHALATTGTIIAKILKGYHRHSIAF
jgi:hypothetical protein